MKPLLIIVLLTLTACSSAPQVPQLAVPPVEPVKVVDAPVEKIEFPAPGSWRYQIVAAAQSEWAYFGQQEVVINGDDEWMPRVGIWEDDDRAHSERVNQYWRAVGMNRLSGFDCKEPWSAAFISWVMQDAGVAKSHFPATSAHRVYLNYFLAHANNPDHPSAAFLPHTIQQYQPQAGDLICATRSKVKSPKAIEELPDSFKAGLHCDIVVANDGQILQVIGGNVRNSVSKTILTLSPDGYLQASSLRPWILILENRLDW